MAIGFPTGRKDRIDSSSLGYYRVRQRENNNVIKICLSNEVVKPDGFRLSAYSYRNKKKT